MPEPLSRLCLRMLEKAPQARYADADALCAALRELLADEHPCWKEPLFEAPPPGPAAPDDTESAPFPVLPPSTQEGWPPFILGPPSSPASSAPSAVPAASEAAPAPAEPPPPMSPPAPAPPPTEAPQVTLTVRGFALLMLLPLVLATAALGAALWPGLQRVPASPPASPPGPRREVAPRPEAAEPAPGAAPSWDDTPAPVAPATLMPESRVKRSPPPVPAESPQPPLSSTSKALGLALALATGCATTPQGSNPLPPPVDCPQEALQGMDELGIILGYENLDGVLLPIEVPSWLPVSNGELKLELVDGNMRPTLDGATAHGTLLCHNGRAYVRVTAVEPENSGKQYPVCLEMHGRDNARGAPTRMDADGTIRMHNRVKLKPVKRFE